MTGSKTVTQTRRFKFDKEFLRIQSITENILGQAFGATLDQRQFQTALFALLQPEFERLSKQAELADELGTPEARAQLLRDTITRNQEITQRADLLSDRAADAALNLGQLTDEDRELISSTLSNARAVGQTAIQDFIEGNFRAGNEVAAARGLRPGDAPIGNIRGRVAEEGTKQAGLLERELASRGSELALQLPLQRASLLSDVAGRERAFAQTGDQFQAALQQNATANRLNLASTAGQLGLGLTGLASTGPGALSASRPALGTFSKTESGGISTKMLKINGHDIHSGEVLSRLQSLPVQAWQYLWENGDQAFQVGPYAEDFQEAFGGQSYQISFLHALGVSMVALQELAGRLDRLEEALGIGVPAEDLPGAV